jgi:hypothetical protein
MKGALMPEPEQQTKDAEKRIFEELTFIGDHLLTVEQLLRELLRQLEGQKKVVIRIP